MMMSLCSSLRTFFSPCAMSSPLVPALHVSFMLPLHAILDTPMQFHSPAPTMSTCRSDFVGFVILDDRCLQTHSLSTLCTGAVGRSRRPPWCMYCGFKLPSAS